MSLQQGGFFLVLLDFALHNVEPSVPGSHIRDKARLVRSGVAVEKQAGEE